MSSLQCSQFCSDRPLNSSGGSSKSCSWSCPGCSCSRPTFWESFSFVWRSPLTVECPFMNFFKILNLTFNKRNSSKFTKHFEQMLDVLLLITYSVWFLLLVVSSNYLLKLFEFRIRIDSQRVNSCKIKVPSWLFLPANQVYLVTEVLLRINHL
jgi:hypothetical protein